MLRSYALEHYHRNRKALCLVRKMRKSGIKLSIQEARILIADNRRKM